MKTTVLRRSFNLLLIILLFNGWHNVTGQIVAPKLIITEFLGETHSRNYVEITNVGDSALNLGHFQMGTLLPWANSFVHTNTEGLDYFLSLPSDTLQPGQSYVIGIINDYADTYYDKEDPPVSLVNFTPVEMFDLIDHPVYIIETQFPEDSISKWGWFLRGANGQGGVYLEYILPDGSDSIVIDVVKADFQGDQLRISRSANDVAGVANGTDNHILVRKTTVTEGNYQLSPTAPPDGTKWDLSRGTDAVNSEWIVLPLFRDWANPDQKLFTTIKHHGNAVINGSTFRSDNVGVDLDNNTLNVPWGVRRDSLLLEFTIGKGLAWQLDLSPTLEDSLHIGVRTNDTLRVFAVGEELQEKKFIITVDPPKTGDNIVLPMLRRNVNVSQAGVVSIGYQQLFQVTDGVPGMDSILGVSFSMRVDTLLKYLEKPANAQWEIVWVDDERPDLKWGDKLKVTAADGTEKEYFIAADQVPAPGEVATLRSITWPDVPEPIMLSPEWGGNDVIPGFNPAVTTYTVKVPYGNRNIPALGIFPTDMNAKVDVVRATNLRGTLADRTTTITVTSEDGLTEMVYSILFQQDLSIFEQPFYAEPLITKYIHRQFTRVTYLEITNPGNRDLDLSKYVLAAFRGWQPVGNAPANPAEIITIGADVYTARFLRYVPGYVYVNALDYVSKPGTLVPDPSVDAILGPGESFVISAFNGNNNNDETSGIPNTDVVFNNKGFTLTEVEGANLREFLQGTAEGRDSISNAMLDGWNSPAKGNISISKILNNEILEGEKGIADPADFQLIDVIGAWGNAFWHPHTDAGTDRMLNNHLLLRKPQYYTPDTIINSTYGTADSSQWIVKTTASMKVELNTSSDNLANRALGNGLGSHVFDPITVYKSTVGSLNYLVSDGYESPQSILGVVTGTTAETFLEGILPADTAQGLTLMRGGDELTMDAVLLSNDTLVVISADSSNITKYGLTVSEGGLDDDAVLVAKPGSGLEVTIDGTTGKVSGIVPGSSIKAVLADLQKPSTAVLNVLNSEGDLVSMYTVNYDTVKVESKANHQIVFEVIAQNNTTTINYSLELAETASDAMLYSNMYVVDNDGFVVSAVPSGTRAPLFLSQITASKGATITLVDKAGNVRTIGNVAWDDLLVVESEDGTTVNNYAIQFHAEPVGKDAYVLSNILTIDQLELMILDVEEGTTVEELAGMLIAAPGATITVLDGTGAEVASGDVAEGFQVKVVSADGTVEVVYDIMIIVSIGENRDIATIVAYPNPTSGEVYLTGLHKDSEIGVYNITGHKVKTIRANELASGRLSLTDQPAGIYLVTVKLESYHLKTLRIVKQ
jgi:hypothetical protein